MPSPLLENQKQALVSVIENCLKSASVSHSVVSNCDPMDYSTLSTVLFRQEYWNGQSFPSLRHLPDPGIKPRAPALQGDSSPSEPPLALLVLLSLSRKEAFDFKIQFKLFIKGFYSDSPSRDVRDIQQQPTKIWKWYFLGKNPQTDIVTPMSLEQPALSLPLPQLYL